MQCSNKLKQLGLALHNYHDTHGEMTSGVWVVPGVGMPSGVFSSDVDDPRSTSNNRFRGSGHIALLPFIEQSALYAEANTTRTNPDTNAPGVGTPWAVQLEHLLCPSDSGRTGKEPGGAGRTNYLFSLGDRPEAHLMEQEARALASLANTPTNPQRHNHRGPFTLHPHFPRSFGSIYDGLSNTIALSESIVAWAWLGDLRSVRIGQWHGVARVHGINDIIQNSTPSGNVNGVRDSNVGGFYLDPIAVSSANGPSNSGGQITACIGGRWASALVPFSAFTPILAPNLPSGRAGNMDSRHVITVSSFHTGGVNAVMLDGHVRFVPETVSDGGRGASFLSNSAGGGTARSSFGVWGAMGSINGGESVSL
jgi:prepilin-type processing-associated H-X9-DG protein